MVLRCYPALISSPDYACLTFCSLGDSTAVWVAAWGRGGSSSLSQEVRKETQAKNEWGKEHF